MADFGTTMAAEPHRKIAGAPPSYASPGPGSYDVSSVNSRNWTSSPSIQMGAPDARRFRATPGGDSPGPGTYRLNPSLGEQVPAARAGVGA